jgi:hypothetical protein
MYLLGFRHILMAENELTMGAEKLASDRSGCLQLNQVDARDGDDERGSAGCPRATRTTS